MAGDAQFAVTARGVTCLFGGLTHEAGMMAAAGSYALRHHAGRHHAGRLAQGHDRATEVAAGLTSIPGVYVAPRGLNANLVYFDVSVRSLTRSKSRLAWPVPSRA